MKEPQEAKCLICYTSIDTSASGRSPLKPSRCINADDPPAALKFKFDQICSLLNIEFPSKKSCGWNFSKEPFPFCRPCQGEIAAICDLKNQLQIIDTNLRRALSNLLATVLESKPKGDAESVRTSQASSSVFHSSNVPKKKSVPTDKYDLFRSSIIQRYSPTVVLQPLEGKELLKLSSIKHPGIRVSSTHPQDGKRDDENAKQFEDPFSSSDFPVDTDRDMDIDPLALSDREDQENVINERVDRGRTVEETVKEIEKKRRTYTQTPKNRLWFKKEVQLLDEATKTYSIQGFKVRDIDIGFKCLTCLKVCKYNKTRAFQTLFHSIRQHVKHAHLVPDSVTRKMHIVTMIDEEAQIYSTYGLKFQKIEDRLKCLVCNQFRKFSSCSSYSPYTTIRRHMKRVHLKNRELKSLSKESITTEGGTPSTPGDDNSRMDTTTTEEVEIKIEDAESENLPPDSSAVLDDFDVHSAPVEQEVTLVTEDIPVADPPPAISLELSEADRREKDLKIQCDIRYSSVELVDAPNKIYTLHTFQFQEVEKGYKCLTCSRVLPFEKCPTDNRGKKQARTRRIRTHIIQVHGDPERNKTGKAVQVDPATKTFEFHGFQFQERDENFHCLSCEKVYPVPTNPKAKRYYSVEMHIWNIHKRNRPTFRGRLVIDKVRKWYSYNESEFQVNAEELQCFVCGSVHSKWSDMIDHIKAEHKETTERKCPLCPFTYTKCERFRVHLQYLHGEDQSRNHVCEICGKRFKHYMDLNSHRFKHRNKVPRAQCPQCSKSFASASQMRVHEAAEHGGEKPFVCEHCGKAFVKQYILHSHLFLHSKERRFKCDRCDKSYLHRPGLAAHIKKVHEADVGPRFDCDVCGRQFLLKGELTTHVRHVHLKLRPPSWFTKRVRDRRKRKKVVTDPPVDHPVRVEESSVEVLEDFQGL